jgi:hypothetical protein
MRLYTTAESLHVEQDERGFDLRVTTVDGDDFLFNLKECDIDYDGLADLMLAYIAPEDPALHSVKADLWPVVTPPEAKRWPGE